MPEFEILLSFYRRFYGEEKKVRLFFSPGRVNLIGEHIDYNGGLVFPCAINKGIYAIAGQNYLGRFRLSSLNFPSQQAEFSLADLKFNSANGWANYPKGVINELVKTGRTLNGLDIVFWGNLPDGAGLSSSACIELLTVEILDQFFNLNLTTLEMVKLCQKAENDFIGVKCGIMDQFAIGFGQKNRAILLNCSTLDYSYAPFESQDYTLVITNSNKKRELAESKYNERRAECDSALQKLQTVLNAENLCQISEQDLDLHQNLLTKNEYSRAKHTITENQRTKNAAEALKNGNLVVFGQLMNSSHLSLKSNYEVTGKELDCIAINAQKLDFVLGSRMTGAGFGGCVISLIKRDFFDQFCNEIGKIYHDECNLKADFYQVEISDGTKEIFC